MVGLAIMGVLCMGVTSCDGSRVSGGGGSTSETPDGSVDPELACTLFTPELAQATHAVPLTRVVDYETTFDVAIAPGFSACGYIDPDRTKSARLVVGKVSASEDPEAAHYRVFEQRCGPDAAFTRLDDALAPGALRCERTVYTSIQQVLSDKVIWVTDGLLLNLEIGLDDGSDGKTIARGAGLLVAQRLAARIN